MVVIWQFNMSTHFSKHVEGKDDDDWVMCIIWSFGEMNSGRTVCPTVDNFYICRVTSSLLSGSHIVVGFHTTITALVVILILLSVEIQSEWTANRRCSCWSAYSDSSSSSSAWRSHLSLPVCARYEATSRPRSHTGVSFITSCVCYVHLLSHLSHVL